MSELNAMLLAAGRGERLRPLTDRCPKPLIEVAGKPLIEHVLDRLAAAGVVRCVVNVSWLGEQIREHLERHWRWDMALEISDEGATRLETGGGIFRVLDRLGPGPFLVANADVYCDFPLQSFAALADDWPDEQRAQLLLVDNPAHHPEGDFPLSADGQVGTAGPKLTYAGISLLDPALFDGATEGCFPLPPLLFEAAAHGRVRGTHHRGHWTDVGTLRRLETLRSELSEAL